MADRLQLTDTFMDIMVKMSEKNVGALDVLGKIMKYGRNIVGTEPLMHFMWLDHWSLYGESIWILYHDVCKESLINFILLLDYVRCGKMRSIDLYQAMVIHTPAIDFTKIRQEMEAMFPGKFNMEGLNGLYK